MATPHIPSLAIRGSTGLAMVQGPPIFESAPNGPRDESKNCKVMIFSPNGHYFAWSNGTVVKVVSTKDWKEVCIIKRPRVSNLAFSPKGTYLTTWEPFMTTPSNPQGSLNMNVYLTLSGQELKGYVNKKHSGWELQWSDDEKLCARNSGSDIFFYENGDLETVANRLGIPKVDSFSLSPGSKPHHIVCYVPGKSGQPSSGRLFQYPKFDAASAVASKSFFQAERLDSFWNQKGTGVLLMTSVEVDTSGASYYGKQSLHYLNTKGETSMVTLGKEGPIYSVAWSPLCTEFCAVYGFMPAKATLYNIKCEPVFDFGTGARNVAYYNPFGNLLILAGFGNLRGGVEIWEQPTHKLVASAQAPDSTWLGWCPDGEHFATATTAPRLRQGNGFKIWHYSGAILFERPWSNEEELWEILWQTYPSGTFAKKPISYNKMEGIAPSQPQASKEVYRPPLARGKESNFKLHEIELPSVYKPKSSLPPGFTEAPTQPKVNQSQNKKKRDARKAKREQEGIGSSTNEPTTPQVAPVSASKPSTTTPTTTNTTSSSASWLPPGVKESDIISDDPEFMKKVKNIKKKLQDIHKLKAQLASGKALEINQKEKVSKEAEIIAELRKLVL